jgi:hypothetical protein
MHTNSGREIWREDTTWRRRWEQKLERIRGIQQARKRTVYKNCKKNFKRRDHLGHLGVDGMIILKRILKEYEGDVDWSHLTQKRNQRSSLLSTITKTEVPQNAGYIRTSRATFLLSRTLLYGVSCFSEDEMNSVKIVLHWEIGNTALHLGAWKHRPLLCSGNVPTLRGAL